MDLKLDEQQLVADFRRLGPGGKKELLDYATFLIKKHHSGSPAETKTAGNQCSLDPKPDERPEAVKEPIFTE